MESYGRRNWRNWLENAYWAIVGLVGLGQPIVDRRSMYGDDPRNDPYSLEFDPDRAARGPVRPRS